jgi:hypothetical protein
VLQTGLWVASVAAELDRAKASGRTVRSWQRPVSRQNRHLARRMGALLVSLGRRLEQTGMPRALTLSEGHSGS